MPTVFQATQKHQETFTKMLTGGKADQHSTEYFHLWLLGIRPELSVKHVNLKFNQWLKFDDYEGNRRFRDLKNYHKTHIGLKCVTPYANETAFMLQHEIMFCNKGINLQPEDFLYEDESGIMRVLPLQQQTNGGTLVLSAITYGNDGSVRSFVKPVVKDMRKLAGLFRQQEQDNLKGYETHDKDSFFYDPNMANSYLLGDEKKNITNKDFFEAVVVLKAMMACSGKRNRHLYAKDIEEILRLEDATGFISGIIPDNFKPKPLPKRS